MPQVTILEGGKPKSFAGVDKLQISLSGGGTSLWVPKDTRLLTALTANVNGTYPPPEGYFGFDTVIVDVPPSQVAGIDPETGQYVLVGTKPSKPDDDDYPVWPTDPTVPDDPWDPDTDGGNDWDPYEVPDGGEWTPPWDDPDTKDEWPDEDVPEMTKEHIPSGIKIVKLPNKTSYIAGDDMDYTGIRVQLLDENGLPFSNGRYANTFVPYDELLFPIPYAPTPSEDKEMYVDNRSAIPYGESTLYGPVRWAYGQIVTALNFASRPQNQMLVGTSIDGGDLLVWGRNWTENTRVTKVKNTSGNEYVLVVSDKPFTVSGVWSYGAGDSPSNSFPKDGYTGGGNAQTTERGTYYSATNLVKATGIEPLGTPFASSADNDNMALLADYIMFGEFEKVSGNMIPVQWVSPYDNVTYTDRFAITVTSVETDPEGGGGGFSGGGGDGTGGEGGGGGF